MVTSYLCKNTLIFDLNTGLVSCQDPHCTSNVFLWKTWVKSSVRIPVKGLGKFWMNPNLPADWQRTLHWHTQFQCEERWPDFYRFHLRDLLMTSQKWRENLKSWLEPNRRVLTFASSRKLRRDDRTKFWRQIWIFCCCCCCCWPLSPVPTCPHRNLDRNKVCSSLHW